MSARVKEIVKRGEWLYGEAVPSVVGQFELASRLWHDGDAMTIGKGKRPRDPNQLAAWTVAVSTGQIPAEEATPALSISAPASPASISEYMATIGRKGGQIGGKRRMKTMTKAERSKIAAKAAKARWKKARKPSN
jgi:hypothetical protein